jgi:hypothetical protein
MAEVVEQMEAAIAQSRRSVELLGPVSDLKDASRLSAMEACLNQAQALLLQAQASAKRVMCQASFASVERDSNEVFAASRELASLRLSARNLAG